MVLVQSRMKPEKGIGKLVHGRVVLVPHGRFCKRTKNVLRKPLRILGGGGGSCFSQPIREQIAKVGF